MAKICQMGLLLRYMEKIRRGEKKIEMRLNDEKRKAIVPGDNILFVATEDPSITLLTEVVEVSSFPTFKELYAAFPKEELGYKENETASYKDMHARYSEERIAANGVLAIRVKVK